MQDWFRDHERLRERYVSFRENGPVRAWTAVVVLTSLVVLAVIYLVQRIDPQAETVPSAGAVAGADASAPDPGSAPRAGEMTRGPAALASGLAGFQKVPIKEVRAVVDSDLRGLGTRVGTRNLVLTSRHVAEGCARLILIDRDGAQHRASLIAEDANNDLALLRGETLPHSRGLAVRGFPPPSFNERVWHVRPSTRRPGQQETNVGLARVADLSRRGDSRLVTLMGNKDDNVDAFVSGDSGGPVTDEAGRLLGIVAGTLPDARAHATEFVQNIGFMVNVGLIELFLVANDVDYQHDPEEPDSSLSSNDALLDYTVDVRCMR